MFNSDTPNQHSLPSQTSSYSLKLWLCNRQMVQHISWSQDHFISLHIFEFISQTFTPGVNHAWQEYTNRLINIANIYINLGYWPSHFKTSSTVIISKPNKTSYDSLKLFCPIVLLNTTSKLFKKMIGEIMQFLSISNNFIHLYQLGRLKYKSTTDVGITLTHFIRSG